MPSYLPSGANLAGLDYETGYGETIVKVPSRSVEGLFYQVRIDNNAGGVMSCDCPGFHYRGECHHIRALLFMVHKREKHKGGGMDTRLRAYYDLLHDPKRLHESQWRVYDYLLRCGPADFGGIAAGLGLPDRAHVTGRVDELRRLQMVEDGGKVGRVHVWRAIK